MAKFKMVVLIVVLATLACCNMSSKTELNVKYKNGKQIPLIDSSESELLVLAPDSVNVGEEYCARILLVSKNKKLIKSFMSCDFSVSLIDTVNRTLDNCDSYQLKIETDTTYFCLQPGVARYNEYNIALLATDINNVYVLKTYKLKFLSK